VRRGDLNEFGYGILNEPPPNKAGRKQKRLSSRKARSREKQATENAADVTVRYGNKKGETIEPASGKKRTQKGNIAGEIHAVINVGQPVEERSPAPVLP